MRKTVVRNMGVIDQLLRLALGLYLVWLGLFPIQGIEGHIPGILISLVALLPVYMAITGSCIVFSWLKIHSLTPNECKRHGHPYRKENP